MSIKRWVKDVAGEPSILPLSVYVKLHNSVFALKPKSFQPSGFREFDEVRERSFFRSPINDHLVTLFTESLTKKPRLIVELGVRDGESTFVFERVAGLCGSKFVSVDIEDYSRASDLEDWIFLKKDDLEFAGEFRDWCRGEGLEPEIDILFIDTSHEYHQTVKEIEAWFPFLSKNGKVFFHDTNLRPVFFRKDRSAGRGMSNRRGVIRALENYFGKRFNERKEFVEVIGGFLFRHYPYCNGLAVLERID